MRSEGQLCRSLISPLLLEFCNSDATVVKDFLCCSSLFAYSLFEAAPKPISEAMPHFVTNDSCMMVKKPDAASALESIS